MVHAGHALKPGRFRGAGAVDELLERHAHLRQEEIELHARRYSVLPMRATGSAAACRRYTARSSECSKTLRMSRGSINSSTPNDFAVRYDASTSWRRSMAASSS